MDIKVSTKDITNLINLGAQIASALRKVQTRKHL